MMVMMLSFLRGDGPGPVWLASGPHWGAGCTGARSRSENDGIEGFDIAIPRTLIIKHGFEITIIFKPGNVPAKDNGITIPVGIVKFVDEKSGLSGIIYANRNSGAGRDFVPIDYLFHDVVLSPRKRRGRFIRCSTGSVPLTDAIIARIQCFVKGFHKNIFCPIT
jgi:hypothetical protein